MSGPTINVVSSSRSSAAAFPLPGAPDPSQANPVAGAPDANQANPAEGAPGVDQANPADGTSGVDQANPAEGASGVDQANPAVGAPDANQPGAVEGASDANQPGAVDASQSDAVTSTTESAEEPTQPAINRQLLSDQIPVLTEIASRGRVRMPQMATAFNEIKALVKSKTIPQETYLKLEESSKEFIKGFQELSKMKASEVQAMFKSDKPTKCATLFNEIDRCFGDIDEQLLSLINNPATRSGRIERLQEDCALMYSRLRTAVMSCAEGDFDAKETLASIVNKVAGAMSGSAGVLEAVKDELAPILTGLAKAKEPGTDTIQVGRAIADAEAALVTLERIKTEGVQVGNGRTIPMQSDMDALIATMRDAITNVRQRGAQHLAQGIERSVERLFISRDLVKNLSREAQGFFRADPKLCELVRLIGKINNPMAAEGVLYAAKQYTQPVNGRPSRSALVATMRYTNALIAQRLPDGQLHSVTRYLGLLSREIERFGGHWGGASGPVMAWSKLGSGARQEVKNLLESLYSRFYFLDHSGMMDDELTHLEEMVNVYNGKADGQIRQSDYKAMIAGNLDAGTVMWTYASGLNSHHIDKEVCNAEITKSKHLGSGAINDVQLLTYSGKDTNGQPVTYNRVFKPAMEARLGFHGLCAAIAMGYNDSQNVIQTNVGAGYMAEKIGAKNVISVTRFGVVNGVPGILMDQAAGVEAGDCRGKYSSKFSRLSSAKQNILRGNLMRELNRLQWADILSGQMDRHAGNYLVDINFNTLDVRVTGIDNDICCGKNMVGMRTLRLSPETFDRYFSRRERSITQGIERHTEGTPPRVTEYLCDMSKMPVLMRNKLLDHVGAHAMCLPTVIDTETAGNIESIDLDAYANDLREVLQDEDAVQAAVSRLREAKAYIGELRTKGNVIDVASWGTADTQKKVAQEQQRQANSLMATTRPSLEDGFVSYRAYEFFWRDFKFMAPNKWKL